MKFFIDGRRVSRDEYEARWRELSPIRPRVPRTERFFCSCVRGVWFIVTPDVFPDALFNSRYREHLADADSATKSPIARALRAIVPVEAEKGGEP